MKAALNDSKAFIRTGEMTPYVNILLESGVVF
jgi:D-ribose pyranase